ncbi:MAG: glycosyltransferase family 2 protein [Bacteroidales bacterium]|nr:glycosyltransferase family 2 protein [Bacteroidales bacterium]
MHALAIIFWILIFIVFYAYIGYGIILFLLVRIKRLFGYSKSYTGNVDYEPDVTLFVTAFNEKDFVEKKVQNSLEMDYPTEKLKMIWITDGSDDGTPEMLKQYENIEVYHEDARNGKIAAMNRGFKFVKTPVVVFSDANTLLGKDSIRLIVKMFRNPKVGCVSGEKRIFQKGADAAAGAGEGLYWKYESTLKKWDAELYSVVGAAGELFAVRTELFNEVERDTLLDDFIISLRIAMQGYTIQYNPEAYAIETASANVKEELKRKIRISAGGIQSIVRLKQLLNIFKYGVLSFQYISHRVLRWSLAPLALLFLIPINLWLAVLQNGPVNLAFFSIVLWLQILFYGAALLGWFLENRKIKVKLLFVPYYFFIMNLSVFLGFVRYVKGKQSVKWERAKRGA